MTSTIVEARSLMKTHRSGPAGVAALRGVSLSVIAGETVAITGPSGCGKSSLLHLLGGLDRPTSGEVWLNGKRIDQLSETNLAILRRREIGFVFQSFNLIPSLTVLENVELPAMLAGSTANDARDRAQSLLAELGLQAKTDEAPLNLSGGEQQRVAIARSLINHPAVIFADEPTGNLDSQSSREVLQLLRSATREGQALVIVTHDARVAAMADRVVTMRDGLLTDESSLLETGPAFPGLPVLFDLEARS